MKKLRCAVIGCGRVGCGFDDYSNGEDIRTHAGSYFKNSNTNLVDICDIDESKLEKYGKKFNVKGLYKNSSKMFKNEKIDCISICTLVDSHLDFVEEAAKYDVKAIFLEKPISNSMENARKIIQICKSHHIKLAINHQRRFDPSYHLMKKFILKKLGKIQLVNVYYGRGIANTCSHLFDILRLLFGEIVTVKGNFSKNPSLNEMDPNLDIELEFENGLIGRLQALDPNYILAEMDIIGSDGRLRVNFVTNNMEYFNISKKNFLDSKNLSPSKIKIPKLSNSPVSLAIKNLVNCIGTKNEPLCTGTDGYKSLELIIAAIQSVKQNKKISLPLKGNNYRISSK